LTTQRHTTPSLTRYWKDIIESCRAALTIKEKNRYFRNIREQTVNVLDDWVYASFQTKKIEDEEKDLEPVVNNETISYSYVNYFYWEKNWEYLVYGANDRHCGYTHCMMCKGLHPKNRV